MAIITHTKISTEPASSDEASIDGPDWNSPHLIDVVELTAALNAFTTVLAGVVPASGAAGRYLKGDGTWSDAAALTAFLNQFTSSLAGIVPASGGGTANFLRADGTWAGPAAGASSEFDTILTPAAITFGATYDNWNPGTLGQNTLIRCTTDASARSVRGLVGGVDQKTVTMVNVNPSTSHTVTWAAEDSAATTINRFREQGLSSGCKYYYDGGISRWCLITHGP